MDNQRVCYPRTTPSQQKVLLQKWEETGDIGQACQKARVCAGTFYYWRARFESGGYEAVEQFASHTPQQPNRTSVEIEQEVVELRRQNESWGKQRITDELAKKDNWIPVISPNTVKRILEDAGPKTPSGKHGAPHGNLNKPPANNWLKPNPARFGVASRLKLNYGSNTAATPSKRGKLRLCLAQPGPFFQRITLFHRAWASLISPQSVPGRPIFWVQIIDRYF